MTSTNVDTLKQAYHHWSESKGSSVDHWLSIMADEIDFRSLVDDMPQIPFGKRPMDRAGVRQYLEGLHQDWEMIYYRVDRYIAQDDDVAVVGATAWRNRRTGKPAETALVNLWRFKDGKAVGFFEFIATHLVATCCQCD